MSTQHTTEDGEMKINITRKSGNVRTGSRAWAAQLVGDWTYEVCRHGDYTDNIHVKVGSLTVAVLDCDRDDDTRVRMSVERGGELIGEALMSDLNRWADSVDLSGDDRGELTIQVTS